MAKTMVHKLLIFCWLVVVIIGQATADPATADPATADPPTPATADPATADPATADPTTPATADPTTPATADPATPATADPATPATADPATPATADPATPATADPATPATADPTTPATADPATPATADPATPATADPATPATADPATPATADPGTPATADPATPATADPGTAATAEPPVKNPCSPNPCGKGSTCEARANDTYFCVCLPGRYYDEVQLSCLIAKVFPGVITLSDHPYLLEYGNKKSEEYLNKTHEIIEAISPGLMNTTKGYINSVVLQLSPAPGPADSRAFWLQRTTGGVIATVDNIFEITSTITEDEANDLITKTIESGVLGKAVYEAKELCSETLSPCDLQSTTCESKDGIFSCHCIDGYTKTNYSDSVCHACPSGETSDGGVCVACGFGFSGFNCEEYWLLALVIVGSVLGGLLLIMFIILPIVAHKPSKKTSQKSVDTGVKNVYESTSTSELKKGAKEPIVNAVKAPAGAVPRIPRASANNGWDRGTNLEMTPSNSRQNLVPVGDNMRTYEDADEMRSPYRAQTNPYPGNGSQINPYAASRPQTNPYAQNGGQTNPYAPNRAQTNPYDQNRAQSNPYAQSRGQTNPYYTHDDGRRLN